MIGLLEIRRRKVQFALIALIVTLISYLVLMINGLGVGLNVLAGSALQNFDADAIAYSDGASVSVIRSELSQATVDAIHECKQRGGRVVAVGTTSVRTLEGAVRSGYLAAEEVLKAIGTPRQLLVPELPRSWLARRLIRKR